MEKKDLRLERERHRQEENKHFILQAAERVFVQKGYSLATVDDIADEAQFSKATLYRYFKSKSDILFEIIYSSFEETYQEIRKIQLKSLSAEEKLRKLIGYIVSYYNKKKNLARILFMEKAAMEKLVKAEPGLKVSHAHFHPKIPSIFKSKMEQISNVTSEIIEEGMKSGEFRKMDAQDASVVLRAMIRGFYFRGPLREKHYSQKETTDLLHVFFLQGIKKHKKV
jgi:AcrR family transcriptional regulator